MILKRLAEIKARKQEIRKALTEDANADLEAYRKELTNLETEENTLNARQQLIDGINDGTVPVTPVQNPLRAGEPNTEDEGEAEQRAAYLSNITGITDTKTVKKRAEQFAKTNHMTIGTDAVKRSITLATGGIATPTRVSGITPSQNTVSSIVDLVHVVDADGMGSDSVSYEKTGMTAEHKKDGEAPAESTPTYGIAKIEPVEIATVAYVSKNLEKTTPLNYQARVAQSALNALRTKVSHEIVNGNPDADPKQIVGIIKADAIEAASDVEISAIDATTLRKIALSYGGDENIEGGGLLLLNKKDLIAFGDVRGTNEKKAVYEINYDAGSTTMGTIKDGGLSVRFCINSGCTAFEDSATGGYSMLYGKALAYQLDLFGPYSVTVSREYKFAEGLLTVLGECLVGGNVIAHNGWIRVKKKA